MSSLPYQCGYTSPISSIQPGIPLSYDSFGKLLSNQFVWKYPGIDHLANGFDIFSGTEGASPIFQLTYCDGDRYRTVQDAYRGNSYQIPFQVLYFRHFCKEREEKTVTFNPYTMRSLQTNALS